jgi:hypothetical protein
VFSNGSSEALSMSKKLLHLWCRRILRVYFKLRPYNMDSRWCMRHMGANFFKQFKKK